MRIGRLASPFVLVVLPALASAAEPPARPSGQFALEVAFSRAAEPGAYVCTAKVTDIADGRVLAQPRVTARAGEPAVTHSGFSAAGGSHDVAVTFTVRSGHEVAFQFAYSRNGKVVSAQSATVKL